MLPMWMFIVLIILICSLLYITRTTEENFLVISKNQLKMIQYFIKSRRGNRQASGVVRQETGIVR